MTDRPVLTIDPGMQFGAVCMAGTRVPADSVAGSVAAGDSVDAVAEDYGVTREEVLVACWWHVTDGEAARSRAKWALSVRRAWGDGRLAGSWAHNAAMILGGHRPGPLADPPDVGA